MSILDLEALRAAPLVTTPFEHCIVPHLLEPRALARVISDFPKIDRGGSFPLSALAYGEAFEAFAEELQGDRVRDAFGEKFQMNLSGHPTTLTVRGKTRRKDGRIHTDTPTKLLTVLIYLDPSWEAEGGRLRLLRSPDDIEDFLTEIVPAGGAMVAFRCRENAWHGHKPYVGERRAVQLNWVTDEAAAIQVERRHRLSAFLKRLIPQTG